MRTVHLHIINYLVIFNTRYGPKGVDIVDCGLPTPEKLAMAAWIRVVRLYHSTRILLNVPYGGLFLQSLHGQLNWYCCSKMQPSLSPDQISPPERKEKRSETVRHQTGRHGRWERDYF